MSIRDRESTCKTVCVCVRERESVVARAETLMQGCETACTECPWASQIVCVHPLLFVPDGSVCGFVLVLVEVATSLRDARACMRYKYEYEEQGWPCEVATGIRERCNGDL